MSPHLSRACRSAVAVLALAALGAPAAEASPTTSTAPTTPSANSPATDSQGFVDSSARCTASEVVVAVGSTDSSKVAICKTSAGQYQYRGVRLRDGAKLLASATENAGGGFVAQSDGITYTLTSKSLDISDASGPVRSEPVVYYRSSGASTPGSQAAAGVPVVPVTGAPTAAPTTPLPPPLPAEVGSKPPGH
jgi:hypothetical protein